MMQGICKCSNLPSHTRASSSACHASRSSALYYPLTSDGLCCLCSAWGHNRIRRFAFSLQIAMCVLAVGANAELGAFPDAGNAQHSHGNLLNLKHVGPGDLGKSTSKNFQSASWKAALNSRHQKLAGNITLEDLFKIMVKDGNIIDQEYFRLKRRAAGHGKVPHTHFWKSILFNLHKSPILKEHKGGQV